MSDIVKIRYEIGLSKDRPGFKTRDVVEIRRIAVTDRDQLAELMLDAYIGTIDYEGEALVEAIDEVDSWLIATPSRIWTNMSGCYSPCLRSWWA